MSLIDLQGRLKDAARLCPVDADRRTMQAALRKRGDLEALHRDAGQYRNAVRQQIAAGNAADYVAADQLCAKVGSLLGRLDNDYPQELMNGCPDTALKARYRELSDAKSQQHATVERLNGSILDLTVERHKARKRVDARCVPSEIAAEQSQLAAIERELRDAEQSLADAKLQLEETTRAVAAHRALMIAA